MKTLFIPFLFVLSLFVSCSDAKDDQELSEKTVSYDVYVAGRENNTACYWKNGQKTNLADGTNITPSKIIVENNHVYVFENNVFWKDNIKTDIRQYLAVPAALVLRIREFYVKDGDVYLLGYVEDPNPVNPSQRYQLCYWKNGAKTIVSYDPGEMVYNNSNYSMTIFQSVVYVSGHQKINGTVNFGYFKNGTFYPVATGYQTNAISSNTSSIYLSGNNFYKNLLTGTETHLTPVPDAFNASSNKILIDNNDVYRMALKKYYKNANEVSVNWSTFHGIADMKALNENIYMIRWLDGSNLTYKVYINDVETQSIASGGSFSSIFVVQN
ncbi:hypothetical protein [Chryseobacterium vaccae]|uniref:hypothetical protein n=1 Tax=Chryseobacterium vaccae TaxID=2604424 RepID=UPI0012974645|nr:hypothetical protein [Chryseobacterium vaccae]